MCCLWYCRLSFTIVPVVIVFSPSFSASPNPTEYHAALMTPFGKSFIYHPDKENSVTFSTPSMRAEVGPSRQQRLAAESALLRKSIAAGWLAPLPASSIDRTTSILFPTTTFRDNMIRWPSRKALQMNLAAKALHACSWDTSSEIFSTAIERRLE